MSENDSWLSSFKPVPIPEYLDRSVQEFSDRPAIEYLGNTWKYQELGELVNKATLGFQKIGC